MSESIENLKAQLAAAKATIADQERVLSEANAKVLAAQADAAKATADAAKATADAAKATADAAKAIADAAKYKEEAENEKNRADESEQNQKATLLLIHDRDLNRALPLTQTTLPGKNVVADNHEHMRRYLMQKLKRLLSRNTVQRIERRRE